MGIEHVLSAPVADQIIKHIVPLNKVLPLQYIVFFWVHFQSFENTGVLIPGGGGLKEPEAYLNTTLELEEFCWILVDIVEDGKELPLYEEGVVRKGKGQELRIQVVQEQLPHLYI